MMEWMDGLPRRAAIAAASYSWVRHEVDRHSSEVESGWGGAFGWPDGLHCAIDLQGWGQ